MAAVAIGDRRCVGLDARLLENGPIVVGGQEARHPAVAACAHFGGQRVGARDMAVRIDVVALGEAVVLRQGARVDQLCLALRHLGGVGDESGALGARLPVTRRRVGCIGTDGPPVDQPSREASVEDRNAILAEILELPVKPGCVIELGAILAQRYQHDRPIGSKACCLHDPLEVCAPGNHVFH